MLQRRQVTLELSEELGQAWPEFKTSAHQSDGASRVGQRLRSALGVTIEQQRAWRDEWHAWREWRAAVESAGVLVFQFPKVPLEQARGVSLFEFPVPVVGINSKEGSPGARVYSLLHELVHVALAVGRDEQVALTERRSASPRKPPAKRSSRTRNFRSSCGVCRSPATRGMFGKYGHWRRSSE
jgi:hypothetical protein